MSWLRQLLDLIGAAPDLCELKALQYEGTFFFFTLVSENPSDLQLAAVFFFSFYIKQCLHVEIRMEKH